MSNMSYCRFENTVNDLEDCFDNWESLDDMSSSHEYRARKRMWLIAQEIAGFDEPEIPEEE